MSRPDDPIADVRKELAETAQYLRETERLAGRGATMAETHAPDLIWTTIAALLSVALLVTLVWQWLH